VASRPVADRSVTERNRDVFDDPAVVEDYAVMQGLFPCEAALFDRYVRSGDRVLDLGVGSGRTTAALVARATPGTYLGIDVAPSMVEAARQMHPGVDLRLGDAADLQAVADGSVDVAVFSYNGLDYVHPYGDRVRCLRELHRVVRPGGTVLVGGHEARALLRWLPDARGRLPRRIAASAVASLTLGRAALASRALWQGAGYRADVARGLVTYTSSRRRLRREVEGLGFAVLESLPAQHPAHPPAVLVPWWLHALRRR
jgi:SAM-dependent methyltransferase